MKFHWKVLAWMLAGVVFGLGLQLFTAAPAWLGADFAAAEGGLELRAVDKGGPLERSRIELGDLLVAVVLDKGQEGEERVALRSEEDLLAVVERSENGAILWFEESAGGAQLVTLGIDPASARARWLWIFDFGADVFMALLKMLIVPIVLTSIIAGVAGVGGLGDLRRLGGKTFAYYICTSMLAIFLGQLIVSTVRPGEGASLGLAQLEPGQAPDASFVDVLKRMVPSNVVEALGDNRAMLAIIFFALLFGYFITQAPAPHKQRVTELFNSLFQVMLRMAEGVLKLLPYGVFCLMVRVVSKTGFGVFEFLLLYMLCVAGALILHSAVTLPMILRFVGRISPLRWFKAMSPALMTAFSTSSSSMTLPVTLETVEKRGKVSNRVTSFTLPLGATINMDGTALYECIGVIFLAQYYSGVSPEFTLTMADQALVVIMALLASIGAAGIPSAGLVMMLAILAALGLPLEGAALLLAVDRPLDMMRTVVNVWSDSCGAAVIARSEGEEGPAHAGAS